MQLCLFCFLSTPYINPQPHCSPIMPKEKALCKEADHMEKASCEFVLRVYGIYLGCPPVGVTPMQQGIVMEFMGRGSIQSLLNDLSGPPPWPLAFRLTHQVALGMNFLHSRNLMHHDLKPSNVLLNDDLNAKVVATNLNSSVYIRYKAVSCNVSLLPL